MSLVKSGFAPVNGLQMYYEIHGSGKPLVLIHGGGSTILSWAKLLPTLAQSRQVIALETQAHGRTKDIDRDFTFEQDADDIAALLRHLNIAKADIFGFSNGGQIAMQVGIHHPGCTNKLIIASIGYKREGFQPWFWPMMKDADFSGMPQFLKDEFLRVNPNETDLLKMHIRDATRMQNLKSWSDDLIRSIKAKTLVVAGDSDVITPEHAVEIHRLIANSRLAILPDGHGSYMTETKLPGSNLRLHEAVINIVTDFLDQE